MYRIYSSLSAKVAVSLAGAATVAQLSQKSHCDAPSGAFENPSKVPEAKVFLRGVPIKNPYVWVENAMKGDGSMWNDINGLDKRLLENNCSRLKEKLNNVLIFSGPSSRTLAEEIVSESGLRMGKMQIGKFADGEISVQINENVRGRDVYVVQSTSPPVNDSLMELYLMITALRRASARSVTAIIPYYGYKRDTGGQYSTSHLIRHGLDSLSNDVSSEGDNITRPGHADNMFKQTAAEGEVMTLPDVPVAAADVAKMLEAVGVDRVVSIDIQPPGQGMTEGFFPPHISVDSLRSTQLGVNHIARLKLQNPVVVAPNEHCMLLAQDFKTGLENRVPGITADLAVLIESGNSGHTSPYYKGNPYDTSNLTIVGDVNGRDVIIVDDIIDTGKSLVTRVKALKELGANRIVAFATHGLFNGNCLARIARSDLTDVVVTNTVALPQNSWAVSHTHKIAQLSVAPILASAVIRLQTGQSLLDLRVFDTKNKTARYSGQE